MKQTKAEVGHLSKFVDSLQSRGQYIFLKERAVETLGSSEGAFKFAALRLSKKRRIVSPRRGFFVIVPVEYQLSGAPPASWFIDDLMKFQEKPYYVGLLSAAALHGAGHQQPQEFQVLTDAPLRPVKVGRERLRFFTKQSVSKTAVEKVKTQTGHLLVSSPEATVVDLIRYQSAVGYLSNVATILLELGDKLRARQLLEAAKVDGDLATMQRLGYLLDLVRLKPLSDPLLRWVSSKKPSPRTLVPTRSIPPRCRRNEKWQIIVNEKVEVDR